MKGDRLETNQHLLVNARRLWDDYHFINSFAPVNGKHNQKDLYEGVEIPFCYDDFVSLLNNNFFKTASGDNGELLGLEWFVGQETAIVNYSIKRLDTDKLNIRIYEPE